MLPEKKNKTIYTLLTQTVSQAAVLSVLPKAVDPVMVRQSRMVTSCMAHRSPNGATHLFHAYRLWPVQRRGLASSVGGYRATKEGSIMATTTIYRAELLLLLLLLLLTLLGHPWVLGLVDPIRKPGDWILWREGSSSARVWGERGIRWCQVVVERSLSS